MVYNMRGRIILQDLDTHSYLNQDGAWSSSCQQARIFDHTYMALLEGLDHEDKHTQVVWCFRDPGANLYMAVRPADKAKIYPCEACPLAHQASQTAPARPAVSQLC